MIHRKGYYFKGYYYPFIVNNNGIDTDTERIIREYFDKNISIRYVPLLSSYGIFRLVEIRFIKKNKMVSYGNGIDSEYFFVGKLNHLNNIQNILEFLKINDPWRFNSFDTYYNSIVHEEEEHLKKIEKQKDDIFKEIGKDMVKVVQKNELAADSYLRLKNTTELAKAFMENRKINKKIISYN